MATTTVTKILFRRGTLADANTITLGQGEPGFTTDTKELYIGDGTTSPGIKIGAAAGGEFNYTSLTAIGLETTNLSAHTIKAAKHGDSIYIENDVTSNTNPAVVFSNYANNSSANTVWVNHQGADANTAAYVAKLSSTTSKAQGFQAQYTADHEAYALSASPAFSLYDGVKYSYRHYGNGDIHHNGHRYHTDANGTSVYFSVSSNSSSGIGVRTDGVNRNLRGNHTFRVVHDYDLLEPGNAGTWSQIYTNQAIIHGSDDSATDEVGDLEIAGELTQSSSFSDKNLKKNIKQLQPSQCAEIINKLKPVTFKWGSKKLGVTTEKSKQTHSGLIAQDVESVSIPSTDHIKEVTQLNDPSETSYKYLKYEKFIPYLIGAIQELTAEIEKLKKG